MILVSSGLGAVHWSGIPTWGSLSHHGPDKTPLRSQLSVVVCRTHSCSSLRAPGVAEAASPLTREGRTTCRGSACAQHPRRGSPQSGRTESGCTARLGGPGPPTMGASRDDTDMTPEQRPRPTAFSCLCWSSGLLCRRIPHHSYHLALTSWGPTTWHFFKKMEEFLSFGHSNTFLSLFSYTGVLRLGL